MRTKPHIFRRNGRWWVKPPCPGLIDSRRYLWLTYLAARLATSLNGEVWGLTPPSAWILGCAP